MFAAVHRYELTAMIGQGGMGSVYRGLHYPSQQPVAVKMLRSGVARDARRKRLLLNEATAAAQLRHPNIVELLDVGRDEDGVPFLVMELVEGLDLEGWGSRWPGWPAVARAFADTLDGLMAAHAAGIIHRDLKPANLLLVRRDSPPSPSEPFAKIADFGVARVLDPLRGESQASGVVGTPIYMAPEQLAGDMPVGPWTDLYAVGVMLRELVSGKRPFAESNAVRALMEKMLRPLPPTVLREGLEAPPALTALVDELLRVDPRQRPRFARDVRDRLAALAPSVVDHLPVGLTGEARASTLTSQPTTHRGQTALGETVSSGEVPIVVMPPAGAVLLGDRTISERDATAAPADDAGEPGHGRTISPSALPAELPAAPDPRPGSSLLRLRDLPMVGREPERAELLAQVERTCAEGGARLLAFVGEAGVGKSRIARWGLAEVERRACMEGAAAGYDVSGAGVSGGLRHALRRLMGLPARRPDAAVFPPEWSWLHAPGEALPFDGGRLERWLRADDTEELLPPDQVAELAHSALRAVSRVRPVYLWADDLGWSRDGALDLVERLLQHQDAAVLIVATLRSGTAQYPPLRKRLEALWRTHHSRVFVVSPLDVAERRTLVQAIVPVAADTADDLAARLDGTPLVLVQLMHEWIESGLLESGARGWRPRAGTSITELLAARPLGALLAQRIDALVASFGDDAAAVEALLLRAALLGTRFDEAALRAAAPAGVAPAGAEPGRLVDDLLDRALLHGLLRAERGRAYRFDHGSVQEALLTRVAGHVDRRSALRDVAAGLVACYGHERADIGGRVASLLREAGDVAEAWVALDAAVQRAAKVGDVAWAAEHLAKLQQWLAEDAVPDVDARRAVVLYAEAHLYYMTIRYDEALPLLERAAEIQRALGDALGAAQARALQADVYFYQDRLADAEAVALECAEHVSDAEPARAALGARVMQRLADLAVVQGDFQRAHQFFTRCHRLALASGAAGAIGTAALNLSNIELALGRLDEAERMTGEVSRIAREAKDDFFADETVKQEARIALYRGDAAAARARLATVLPRLEARGDRWYLTELRLFEALIAAELDPQPDAAQAARRFIAAYREVRHDEAQTLDGMRRLRARLQVRGEVALAIELQRSLDARARVAGAAG